MINKQEIDYDQDGIIGVLKNFESPEDSTVPYTPSFEYLTRGNVCPNVFIGKSFIKSRRSYVQEYLFPKLIIDFQGDEDIVKDYSNCVDLPIQRYLNEITTQFDKVNFDKVEIIKSIISFRSLQNNWDGYGAYPLEVESATNAIKFINLIEINALTKLDDIYPNPNGTISFIWENVNNDKLSLEIGKSTFSYYFKLTAKEPLFFDNVEINHQEVKKVSDFIRVM